MIIKPTIGRVVLVFNRRENARPQYPEAALVSYVHSDTLINVGGVDHSGVPFSVTSIELEQEGRGTFAEGVQHAEWMPYQKGQAAKTEALETQLAAR